MKKFSDLGVGGRLAIGFASTAALLVVVSGVAVRAGGTQERALDAVEAKTALSQAALDMKFELADLNGWQTAYSLDVNLAAPNATADDVGSRQMFLARAAEIETDLASLAAMGLDAEETAIVDELTGNFTEFMALDDTIIESYREATPRATEAANELVLGEAIDIFTEMTADIGGLSDKAVADSLVRAEAAHAAADDARTLILSGAAIALLAAVLLGRLISRSITVPLRTLEGRLGEDRRR